MDHLSKKSPKSTIIIVVAIVALLYGCNKILCRSDPALTKIQQDSIFFEKEKLTAFTMSQTFVKQRLIAPATAEFSGSYNNECKYIGDSIYTIQSNVDSQNSFGALIRTRYYAKVKYAGGDNWNLVDIKLFK